MRSCLLVLAVALAGCGNPLDVRLVPVNVQGDLAVSPSDPGTFVVSAENKGNSRITWGMGSSSCQLSLFAVADDIRHRIDSRVCTADFVEQGLNPGERRSETFQWDGHIPDIEGQPFLLPEGRYHVIGAAGSEGESEPLVVTVRR